jgi:hypothetical protein
LTLPAKRAIDVSSIGSNFFILYIPFYYLYL